MEAKKNGRMTIRILSEEFEKEVKSLKGIVKLLEKRLDDSEKKVEILEDKLGKREEVVENCLDKEIECKVCEFKCESKQNLKKHIKENHPFEIECNLCATRFPKKSDLEVHLEVYHERKGQYKCDHCDKTFVLKWRLKKHLEVHSKSITICCHYYNNEKPCPYEQIGCMFLHEHSKICSFGGRCRNKLCQFKHPQYHSDDNRDTTKTDLADKFNQLTEEEKYESREVLCDLYCKADMDSHRCSDDSFEALNGCDVLNITEGFENDDEDADVVTYFPCSKCDERYDSYQKLNTHFSSNHTPDKAIQCCLNGCNFSSTTINLLIMHIGVNHLDVVRKKL